MCHCKNFIFKEVLRPCKFTSSHCQKQTVEFDFQKIIEVRQFRPCCLSLMPRLYIVAPQRLLSYSLQAWHTVVIYTVLQFYPSHPDTNRIHDCRNPDGRCGMSSPEGACFSGGQTSERHIPQWEEIPRQGVWL